MFISLDWSLFSTLFPWLVTLFAETRSKWKLLMYKVLRKFNTLQVFFLLIKAFCYVQFLQLYKILTKKFSSTHCAWFVFPVQAYFPKYFTMCVICKMYVTCSMFTRIFPFLWDSVLITTGIAAMILYQLDIDSDFFHGDLFMICQLFYFY